MKVNDFICLINAVAKLPEADDKKRTRTISAHKQSSDENANNVALLSGLEYNSVIK